MHIVSFNTIRGPPPENMEQINPDLFFESLLRTAKVPKNREANELKPVAPGSENLVQKR
jgi:hypothetical protein